MDFLLYLDFIRYIIRPLIVVLDENFGGGTAKAHGSPPEEKSGKENNRGVKMCFLLKIREH
jgi:hypothetical protein